jgi:hypothetical protein
MSAFVTLAIQTIKFEDNVFWWVNFKHTGPEDCGVSFCVCDLRTSTMRSPWPALGCWAKEENNRRENVNIIISV